MGGGVQDAARVPAKIGPDAGLWYILKFRHRPAHCSANGPVFQVLAAQRQGMLRIVPYPCGIGVRLVPPLGVLFVGDCMGKIHYPVTQAIRFLRQQQIAYVPHVYDYVEHGGTAHAAACLGVDEHCVIKTIVLCNEHQHGLVVLMHGDRQISTRKLARLLGMKHIEPASPAQAQRLTGYLVGGTSPFGLKSRLPVYVEHSIFALPEIYINGGKRGLLVSMVPAALDCLSPHRVAVAQD